MHILYFIRHGQYDDKDTRTDCTGKELLSKGKQQAELTGSWLAEKEPALTSIYCSDYVRARQTAGIIRSYFTNIPLHVLQDLRECENLYYKDYRTSPSSFLDNLMKQPEMFFPKNKTLQLLLSVTPTLSDILSLVIFYWIEHSGRTYGSATVVSQA